MNQWHFWDLFICNVAYSHTDVGSVHRSNAHPPLTAHRSDAGETSKMTDIRISWRPGLASYRWETGAATLSSYQQQQQQPGGAQLSSAGFVPRTGVLLATGKTRRRCQGTKSSVSQPCARLSPTATSPDARTVYYTFTRQQCYYFRRRDITRLCCSVLNNMLNSTVGEYNPFKPSGANWLHYKVFKTILV